MGGSGAGKTTLMDVLAGRKNQGVIKGDLMINGHPKVQETWARVVGYVEQVCWKHLPPLVSRRQHTNLRKKEKKSLHAC